jgi:hypothetical protein
MLPILFLGTGINTGVATVGLMGSAAQTVVRQGSYTVFGRDVNLASRIEGLSGRGHIYISQSTYEHLRRDDPALASICLTLPPMTVKGIRTAVQLYEVPWQLPAALPSRTNSPLRTFQPTICHLHRRCRTHKGQKVWLVVILRRCWYSPAHANGHLSGQL